MTDAEQQQQDAELKRQLDRVEWPMRYGSVKVQIRNGVVDWMAVERTIKFDKQRGGGL